MPQSHAVTVRFFAAAREAAGTAAAQCAPGSVAEVSAELSRRYGPGLQRVLSVSSLLLAGERLQPQSAAVAPAGAVIDVLPPFAGG